MKYETNMNIKSTFLRTWMWAVLFIRDFYIQNIHIPVIKAQYHEFAAFWLSKTLTFYIPISPHRPGRYYVCVPPFVQMELAKAIRVVCPFPPRCPVGPPGASESARVTT